MAFDNGRSLTAEELYEQILKGNYSDVGKCDTNESEETYTEEDIVILIR